MIKSNELRHCNYYLFGPDVYGRLYIDDKFRFYVEFLREGNGSSFLTNFTLTQIEPIKITEEILINFGFLPLPHFNIGNSFLIDIGRNRYLSISSVNDPNQMMWLCSRDEDNKKKVNDLICLHNFDFNGWLHVHQLQNIFYSLTGEELQLNKKLWTKI